MNPIGRTSDRRCHRISLWLQSLVRFFCSLVYAMCVWPLQGKNRLIPRLLTAGPAIVPDDKLTIALGTSKADARPLAAIDVKSARDPAATRAPRKKHWIELQSSIKRVHKGKIYAYPDHYSCETMTIPRQRRGQKNRDHLPCTGARTKVEHVYRAESHFRLSRELVCK
jgi:hypothetical protein